MKPRVTENRTYIHLAIGQTFNSVDGRWHKGFPGSLFCGCARRAIPAGPGLWAARDCATPYRRLPERASKTGSGGRIRAKFPIDFGKIGGTTWAG